MIQLALPLTEKAAPRIEQMLSGTCPVHQNTTLEWDGIAGLCPVCDLEAGTFAEPQPVSYPAFTPEWVRRANESNLPYRISER